MTDTPDPQLSFFTTPGIANIRDEIPNSLKLMAPTATVIPVASHNFLDELLASIREQVLVNGTQKTLVIDSHGAFLTLFADGPAEKDRTAKLFVPDLLAGINKIQTELGLKVTDRLVLAGCSIFAELPENAVGALRYAAKTLGTEIVGATDTWYGGNIQAAPVVHFGADGSVAKDYLDKPYEPNISWDAKAIKWINSLFLYQDDKKRDSWVTCHEGKTQEEGAACQTYLARQNFLEAERGNYVEHGGAFVPNNNNTPDQFRLSKLGAKAWLDITVRIDYEMPDRFDQRIFKKEINGLVESAGGASPHHDRAAVAAHESFIASMSPETKEIVGRYVADYEAAHSVPTQRTDSRDVGKLKADANTAAAPKPDAHSTAAPPPASPAPAP